MSKLRVLFISSEIMPYVPESHISKICRYLPQGIQESGKEIRAFMPRYGIINERRNQLHEVIRLSGMNLIIDDTDHSLIIKVASIQAARMQIYFIDNEDFFSRKHQLSDAEGKYFEDNDERSIFFARGVLETVKKLRWAPDIVHCHGWMSALVPAYLKHFYKDDAILNHSKIIYSLYNDNFSGNLNTDIKRKLTTDISGSENLNLFDSPDYNNYIKFAMQYSDAIIKGHPEASDELMQFAKDIGKKTLDYQGDEDYISSFSEFYDSLM
ncbi:MAG: glycogen/starch synthase [Bacteroidales bacterium]|nr:glycogen/starch synthase [Bacteroidales bacterium]